MPDAEELNEPWLIAAWPGMGSVALLAGSYLVEKLGAEQTGELSSGDLFDIQSIDVKAGLAGEIRMPRQMIFEWKDPKGRHDLIVFIAEAQPTTGGYALCHRLLDFAQERGVTKLFTFAAMSTQLHPMNEPRVFGVASDPDVLAEIEPHGVDSLDEGQINGLNGVLIAAGAERAIPGACLMGELPFFAAGVPNPKASLAVLEVFGRLSGVEIDLDDLREQGRLIEGKLLALLEKLRQAARETPGNEDESFVLPDVVEDDATDNKTEPSVDAATERHISQLFDAAERDRTAVVRLKEELDRLGLFKRYEDRFLDLFKSGE